MPIRKTGRSAWGRSKPSDFGLFDVYGNALEWCQDLFFDEYPVPDANGVVVDGSDERGRRNSQLRGVVSLDPPSVARSAWRDFQVPVLRSYEFGFRIARTCEVGGGK